MVIAFQTRGCYPRVEWRDVDPFFGATQPEIDEVTNALRKAGVEGDVTGLRKDGNNWYAEVPKTSGVTKEGKRIPLGGSSPPVYQVNKQSGKTTRLE
jgi:hypothetical protein